MLPKSQLSAVRRLAAATLGAAIICALSVAAHADPVDGDPGSDGAAVPAGTAAQIQSGGGSGGTGYDGSDSDPGGAGGSGGNGGDITAVVSADGGATDIYSLGGDGGSGGAGGTGDPQGMGGKGGAGGDAGAVNVTQTGNASGRVFVLSTGGASGGSGTGEGTPDGGRGGNSGNATLYLSGDAGNGTEGAYAISGGGDSQGGPGSRGGDSGSVEIFIAATSTVDGLVLGITGGGDGETGGNAGHIVLTIEGIVDGGVLAQSTGGDGEGDGSTYGDGGDITVSISGTVQGNVTALSYGRNSGTISIILDGGVVDGTIAAWGAGDKSLSFQFDVADRAEFTAASSVLTSQAATGTVTINGHIYAWEGFDSLVNALRHTGVRDVVVVTVIEPGATSASTSSDPEQVRPLAKPRLAALSAPAPSQLEAATCSSPTVRAIRQTDGSVLVVSRSSDGGHVIVGKLTTGSFQRAANAPDWNVSFGTDQMAHVTDSSGNDLGSCSF